MMNGNMIGGGLTGSSVPASAPSPTARPGAGKPADYDALKQQFNVLAESLYGGGTPTPEPTLNEPQTGAEAPESPVAGSKGTSEAGFSKAIRGALKGAANAASDEEAIAMLQAILTR
jgi:hypothetical protein